MACFYKMIWLISLLLWTLQFIFAQNSLDRQASYAADASIDKTKLEEIMNKAASYERKSEMNITTVEGGEVILPCSMVTGEKSAVAWMDKMDNVLFYNEQRIIDDERFEMLHSGNQWNLQIKNVSTLDGGQYRCLLNSSPVQLKFSDLIVYKPPKIDRVASSQNIIADEGMNVTLICNASGYPQPKYKWSVMKTDDSRQPEDIPGPEDGQVITIYNTQRNCEDIYICTADNGYGAGDQLQISVKVTFPPNISLPNKKLYHTVGGQTVLSCEVDAFPLGVMYWTKDGAKIKDSTQSEGSRKYKYSFEESESGGRIMRLTIYHIQDRDFGFYKCSASNTKGRAEEYMELINQAMLKKLPALWPYDTSTSASPYFTDFALKPSYTSPRRPSRAPRPGAPLPSPVSSVSCVGVILSKSLLILHVVVVCLFL
ncbi:lachesin-like [Watersipora subatra]|uniref:lachesin-like n=1 Tax=Watersipora subatra TaxID=2589382 RepID=UPI00355C5B0F